MLENKELIRARKYAFRLLKLRPRSENEIRFRLKQKKYSQDVAETVVNSLKDSGYVDDFNFAVTWVRERINRPLGLRRLEFELKQKGIVKEIIDSVLLEAKKHYPERQIILDLIKIKFKKMLPGKVDYNVRGKIQGYLLRRGFSPEVIMDVLEEL